MVLLNDTSVAILEKKDEYGVKILRISPYSVNFITKLGRIGGGPDDVLFGVTTVQKDSYNSSTGIWIGDSNTMKFYPYDSVSNTWEEKASNIKKISTKLFPSSNSIVLGDSTLLGVSSSIDNLFFIYSPDNDSLKGYDFYPLDPNPYDHFTSKTVYSCDMALKPDKSRFVLSYELFKSLCIVSLDNLSEPLFLTFKNRPNHRIGTPDGKINIDELRSLPIQYMSVYTTDRFIYALYVDKTGEELSNYSHETSQGMYIHVFNWDGTTYCSLNLGQIVNCFCVDEANNVIYGLDPTAEKNSVFYKFQIPDNILNIK